MCDYIDEYVKKETYLKAYGGMRHSLLNKSMWPQVDIDEIQPPLLKRSAGMPKFSR